MPIGVVFHYSEFTDELEASLDTLKEKCQAHPELFGVDEGAKEGDAKILLDALYEEGIIPTYSFPKNVVSTYIPDINGKILYEVDRGLDVAKGGMTSLEVVEGSRTLEHKKEKQCIPKFISHTEAI